VTSRSRRTTRPVPSDGTPTALVWPSRTCVAQRLESRRDRPRCRCRPTPAHTPLALASAQDYTVTLCPSECAPGHVETEEDGPRIAHSLTSLHGTEQPEFEFLCASRPAAGSAARRSEAPSPLRPQSPRHQYRSACPHDSRPRGLRVDEVGISRKGRAGPAELATWRLEKVGGDPRRPCEESSAWTARIRPGQLGVRSGPPGPGLIEHGRKVLDSLQEHRPRQQHRLMATTQVAT
jgi:hypothetical protein